jgi:ArsR family transcriptional regulator
MATRIKDVELVCKALADVTRLRIIGLLLAGEVCVCDIHETLKIPQPKASRHLAYLKKAGLVDARREGLWMHYRLTNMADPVLRTIRDAVGHAITHLDPVRRDADRLQKATGCCAPRTALEGAGKLACCAPSGTDVAAGRLR